MASRDMYSKSWLSSPVMFRGSATSLILKNWSVGLVLVWTRLPKLDSQLWLSLTRKEGVIECSDLIYSCKWKMNCYFSLFPFQELPWEAMQEKPFKWAELQPNPLIIYLRRGRMLQCKHVHGLLDRGGWLSWRFRSLKVKQKNRGYASPGNKYIYIYNKMYNG